MLLRNNTEAVLAAVMTLTVLLCLLVAIGCLIRDALARRRERAAYRSPFMRDAKPRPDWHNLRVTRSGRIERKDMSEVVTNYLTKDMK